ncbi:Adenylate cyclase [Mycena venus]|uniref:ATP pyrophosphate-lyase n=1 Tax=Mycena venus TaxID=2733690 RepID=A0A8H6XJ72_9AGAR|nr:Adenylate cyclase [Mycena venus]
MIYGSGGHKAAHSNSSGMLLIKRIKRPRKTSVLPTPSIEPPSHPADVPPLPTIEPPDPSEQELKLDMNFNEMDGIIGLDVLNEGTGAGPAPGSPIMSSDSESDPASSSGIKSLSSDHQFGSVPPKFHNPFSPDGAFYQQRKPSRKVSPNTVSPLPDPLADGPGEAGSTEGWTAPESWSVAVKDGTDPVGETEESSSDESGGGTRYGQGHRASVMTGHRHGHYGSSLGRSVVSSLGLTPRANEGLAAGASEKEDYGVNGALVPVAAGQARRAAWGERTTGTAEAGAQHKILIRIYKADNTYHVVSVSTNSTVAALTPKIDQKLPASEEREMHQLYLKENGRERLLAQTERPADIVLRRLKQAGYDETDGQELLSGARLTFLLKFVYKSLFLGPADEELKFDNFEYIDLTGHSLRTIPVALHQHADSIVSLRLSRNPMIEIPLDFIHSCTTLRELRLSHMAMKKVPHSLRHSTTLTRLDLSCNRIVTLDEAYLDDIPGLTTLHVQNNRLEKLPWSFPRLRRLVTLNISNNKFCMFPTGVSELVNLRDLDISFNMILEIPEEIGKLRNLERLIIVGNQVSKLPDEFNNLSRLGKLDCRRNQISDLTVACMLPKIETLSADHNALHELTLSMGPCLTTLDASHNEITQLSLVRGPIGRSPFALTLLDISNAKLAVLYDHTLSQLTSLRRLKLDNNSFRSIPESLGDLKWLEELSCADNLVGELPQSIGKLQKLEMLDVHNNKLTELPSSLWNCVSLSWLNVTSNSLVLWHDPPPSIPDDKVSSFSDNTTVAPTFPNNSTSTISGIPFLAYSLERLYLGANSITDEILHLLMVLKELRVLNLSFNNIQEMPPNFFHNLTKLEEVYLSGNRLMDFPTEDLPKLTRLSTLFLNGNRLQTLPQELGKVKSLTVLDAGSNRLKYNINNWEFDWNWNFNKNLRYLNLSDNERLQIKSGVSTPGQRQSISTGNRESLAGFSELTQLRVLGLMDVTITTMGTNTTDIPDENDDRRVRTSSSVVNGMSYGIADTLGKNEHLNVLDLVHEFRGIKKDAVFAMFGRAQPPKQLPAATISNRLAKYLQENFVRVFISQSNSLDPERNDGIPDALRRSFLKLNQDLYEMLFSSLRKLSQTSAGTNPVLIDPSIARSGASGIVVYILDKKMYVANVGNALAVVSKGGSAVPLSRKHDPYDHAETARIRAAEGWISPPGLVGDEVDISRSFGFYHLFPIVNARPDIVSYDLTELDEFVIVANRGLWDYVSYQTAVDIAQGMEPMIAAQKLRDLTIGYGAEGSTMIMVISVADLFGGAKQKKRGPQMAEKSKPRPLQSLLVDKKLPPVPLEQETEFDDFQAKHEETRNVPTATKRSGEGLRFKDDDLLNDKQQIDSISLVDAFLNNQQRRAALLAQSLSSAHLRGALQSCDRLIGDSLSAILNSRDCKDAVLLLKADRAQSFLDAVQNARRLVVRLSAASEQLPSSLFISGVTDHDELPTFWEASAMCIAPRMSESKRIRLQFCREALVWQTLQHEYILPLIGIDRETFPLSFCMVSPWMKHGTILQYLSQHGRADVDKLLLQVAKGLGYLHSMKIVHGDLRGTNILVSDEFNACLADFGLTSVIAATTDTSSTNHAGSTRWWAPELMQPSDFGCDRFMRTPNSDVYAFACLHTGRPPFFDAPEASVILKVIAGERPARPESMSDDLWALVTAAWAQNFCDRPDIKMIIGSMRTNAGLPNHG